jgi:hypothetical protein
LVLSLHPRLEQGLEVPEFCLGQRVEPPGARPLKPAAVFSRVQAADSVT